jgi:hypothetical protein
LTLVVISDSPFGMKKLATFPAALISNLAPGRDHRSIDDRGRPPCWNGSAVRRAFGARALLAMIADDRVSAMIADDGCAAMVSHHL